MLPPSFFFYLFVYFSPFSQKIVNTPPPPPKNIPDYGLAILSVNRKDLPPTLSPPPYFYFFFYYVRYRTWFCIIYFHVTAVFQVPPAELEGLLRTHPSVLDAAVIGVPDDRTGEAPLAYVVLDADKPAASEEDVKRYVEERVAPYKNITAGVRFVETIPKSPAGKILRRILKDEYMKTARK